MSQTLEQLVKASGYSSLEELKANMATNLTDAQLVQAMEQIENGMLSETSLMEGIPQLASDISDEANQKKSQKRLLEMLRGMGMALEQQREAGFPMPDKETTSR